MINKVQLFVHERFGKVRVVMINGEPYFVGKDVALALGYKKPENAIAMHVDDEDKTTTLIQGTGSNYKSKTVVINESGMYALILSSKLEKAREFKHWVTFEVLPSIRKTGSYSLVDKPAAERKPRKCHDIIAGYAFVYVFLLSNGLVKIGCSGNPRTRAAEIKRKTDLTLERVYVSSAMLRERAFFIEWLCQENFSSRRVKGEIFSVDFAEVCATLDVFARKISLPLISKLHIATVNLKSAEKSE